MFWDKFKKARLNHNQQKVLNKVLDIGVKNFRGYLTVKRYSKIAKVDIQTAHKEISELCLLGCLVKNTDISSNDCFTLPQNLKIQQTNKAQSKSKIRRQR